VIEEHNPRCSSQLLDEVLALEIILLLDVLIDAEFPMFSGSTEELESSVVQSCGALLPTQVLYLYRTLLMVDVGEATVGSMIDGSILKESFAVRRWNSVLECGSNGGWFLHWTR
jgi:hypothetical protein